MTVLSSLSDLLLDLGKQAVPIVLPATVRILESMAMRCINAEVQDSSIIKDGIKDIEDLSQSLEAICAGTEELDLKEDETARYWVGRAKELAGAARRILEECCEVKCGKRSSNVVDLHGLREDMIRLKAKASEFQSNMAVQFIRERSKPENHQLQLLLEKLMKDATGSSSHIQELEDNPLEEFTRSVLFRNDADVIGFDDHRNHLLNRLRDDQTSRVVISIVAPAGRGKTTLALQVYSNVGSEEFPVRIWLNLVGNEGIQSLLLGMAHEIGGRDREELAKMDAIGLRKHVNENLKNKRYLVVLDNLRESDMWTKLKSYLPECNNRSRVIITSRSENVASRGSVFRLGALDHDHSWELFKREAAVEEGVEEGLKEVAERIVRRCHGLPLELVLLGRLLSKQEQSAVAWEYAVERYQSGQEQEARILSDSMRLSYTHLPADLVPFFLYLAAFPSGFLMEEERLVQLYVAEGLVANNKEETARMFLRKLEKTGLIDIIRLPIPHTSYGVHEYTNDDSANFCRVHAALHAIAKEEAAAKGFLKFQGDAGNYPDTPMKRVALHGNAALDEDASTSLESILDFRKATTSVCFANFLTLKVLLLEGIQVRSLPPCIGNLVSLLHLGIKDSRVAILPESIARLSNLLTLDARNSYLLDLPKGVWKIRTLRHVYSRSHPWFERETVPVDLQTFDGARMGLWVESVLPLLRNLLTLSLFGTEEQRNICCRSLPSSLVKIRLFDVMLRPHMLKLLQILPSLEVLHLVCCFLTSEELICSANGFPKLQVLIFMDMVNFKSWKVEETAMPSLRNLSLIRCAQLTMLPQDLRNIIQAEELHCVGMSEGFVQSVETARSPGMPTGRPDGHGHSQMTITSCVKRKATDTIHRIVSMLSQALVPPPLANEVATREALNKLRKMMDEVELVMGDVRDAKHALSWSAKGDQWAEIWVQKIEDVERICGLSRSLLVEDWPRQSLAMDLQSTAEQLKNLRKGLGLPYY